MQKIKNENGITVIILVITIIVLFILASVSVNIGISSIKQTKNRKLQSELQMVQQVAIAEYTKAKQLGYINENRTPSNFIGTIVDVSELPDSVSWEITSNPEENYKAYYELTPEDLKKFDILNSQYTYILNYYTGEVYNKTEEKTSNGTILYIKASSSSHEVKTEDDTNFNDWE